MCLLGRSAPARFARFARDSNREGHEGFSDLPTNVHYGPVILRGRTGARGGGAASPPKLAVYHIYSIRRAARSARLIMRKRSARSAD